MHILKSTMIILFAGVTCTVTLLFTRDAIKSLPVRDGEFMHINKDKLYG